MYNFGGYEINIILNFFIEAVQFTNNDHLIHANGHYLLNRVHRVKASLLYPSLKDKNTVKSAQNIHNKQISKQYKTSKISSIFKLVKTLKYTLKNDLITIAQLEHTLNHTFKVIFLTVGDFNLTC